MSAQNTTSAIIAVVLGGTDVPLPNNQNLSTFGVDATNTIFTVPETGRYLISYGVQITIALLLSTQITLNGGPLSPSIITPTIAQDIFSTSFIVNLTAGDSLTLQLFGLLGAATLSGGASTYLTVIRLE